MQELLGIICDEIKEMLLEKNKAYGNSAVDPVRIFSKASNEEAILIRIDDKLSRISKGYEYENDDTILDLIGYLILLRAVRRYNNDESNTKSNFDTSLNFQTNILGTALFYPED